MLKSCCILLGMCNMIRIDVSRLTCCLAREYLHVYPHLSFMFDVLSCVTLEENRYSSSGWPLNSEVKTNHIKRRQYGLQIEEIQSQVIARHKKKNMSSWTVISSRLETSLRFSTSHYHHRTPTACPEESHSQDFHRSCICQEHPYSCYPWC